MKIAITAFLLFLFLGANSQTKVDTFRADFEVTLFTGQKITTEGWVSISNKKDTVWYYEEMIRVSGVIGQRTIVKNPGYKKRYRD